MKLGIALIIAIACASGAMAEQAAPAGIITTSPAQRSGDAVRDFVHGYAAPSARSGKLTYWRGGICPATAGLPPAMTAFVTKRVKQVAALAGAHVRDEPDCKPNIDIVFSMNPQRVLDAVRLKEPVLLGYHDVARADDAARVTEPVQAWYATQTVDLRGHAVVDDNSRRTPGDLAGLTLTDAHIMSVTGNHIDNGISSELYHVMVIVDIPRLNDHVIGPVADYIAMLALAQTASFGQCPGVPSITGLMAANCKDSPAGLSDIDLAYLRGLYTIDARDSLQQQLQSITDKINKDLGGT